MADIQHPLPEHGDQELRRLFAAQAAPAPDPAFIARISLAVALVERRRRWLRLATAAAIAAGSLLATPWVVDISLQLAAAAISPVGAMLGGALGLAGACMTLQRAR